MYLDPVAIEQFVNLALRTDLADDLLEGCLEVVLLLLLKKARAHEG